MESKKNLKKDIPERRVRKLPTFRRIMALEEDLEAIREGMERLRLKWALRDDLRSAGRPN